jgi:phenylalanyl-tRNA synthetase beta chain
MALQRVVALIVATAGGKADPLGVDLRPRPLDPTVLRLRPVRVERLLGVALDETEIASLLRPIGFDVGRVDGALSVLVPGYRPDVTREVDLIEEVARRRGYDSFDEVLRPFRPSNAPQDPIVPMVRRVHEMFQRWGFMEARTVSFAPETPGRVPLLNPLSSEESHLRDDLISGLLRRVEHNWARGVRDIRLYEVGTVFLPATSGELPQEEIRVAAVATGGRRPPHWSGAAEPWDRWDLKAILAEIAGLLGDDSLIPSAGEIGSRALEPADAYRSPARPVEGGRVRPTAIDAPLWAEAVWALEATLPEAPPPKSTRYHPLPEHPASERDLALVGSRATPAARIEEVLRESAGDLLEEMWPFDLYEGQGIPEGERSLAWRLRFRHPERTLTDGEVDQAIGAILAALREQLDVRRR